MASKTFNRKPLTVNVSEAIESEKTFFNHVNWKGINQNRNFLTVDQETFSDADNVFVDDKGVLISRPPLKFKNSISNKRISDINIYGKIVICLYQNKNGEWYLGAISDAVWVADIRVTGVGKLKTFRNGDYVYIFTDKIIRYDDGDKKFHDATLYRPITRIYDGENFENFEDENLFSSYSKYRYLLYPSTTGNHLSDYLPQSAYGNIVEYEYWLNDDIKRYQVGIERNMNFLGHVHLPLLYDDIDIKTTNCYGVEVPLIFCHNNFLYRYDNGKVLRLSMTDQKYELLCEFEHSDDNFVKFKYQYTGHILIIYKYRVNVIDLQGNIIPVYFDYGQYVDAAISKTDESFMGSAIYWKQRIDAGNTPQNEYHLVVGYYNYYNDSQTYIKICEHNSRVMVDADICTFKDHSDNGLVSFAIATSSFKLQNTLTLPSYGESSNDRGAFKTTSEPSPDHSDDWTYKFVYEQTDTTTFAPKSMYNLIQVIPDENSYEVYIGARHGNNDFYYGNFNLTTNKFSNSLVLSDMNVNVYGTKNVYVLDNSSLYFNSNSFLDDVDEFTMTNNGYWFAKSDGVILSNYRTSIVNLDSTVSSKNQYKGIEYLIKNNDLFVSYKNDLFVGNIVQDDDEEFLWFKKSFKHQLENEITGFHRVSDIETAIFTTDDTWYAKFSDNAYFYFPTKIKPVLKNGSETITLLDSTTTLIPAREGIMSLSYQNFVNTTEQSTLNLTENVTEIYNNFTSFVKCINWKNYIFFYGNDNLILIFDSRNRGWWKWSLPKSLSKLFVYDEKLYAICDGSFYEFSNSLNDYFDITEINLKIHWYFESQKLHFNANNNYKHLINLTLFGLEENDQPLSLDLNVKNYRKYVDEGKPENFDYRIDVIRTFVKRLNYSKVCEFQYKLSSDENNAIDAPLALSGISIKYKIGGQVR